MYLKKDGQRVVFDSTRKVTRVRDKDKNLYFVDKDVVSQHIVGKKLSGIFADKDGNARIITERR